MRAKALAAWVKAVRGEEVAIQIHEVLEETHGIYRWGVWFYNWIQRNAPWLHHIYFNCLEVIGMHRHADRIFGRDKFISVVRHFRPSVVVSVHAHTNHGFFDLAKEALPDAPPRCITYCGELFGGYGLSRHWVNPAADLFIGAVPDICEAAIQMGVPATHVRCGGFLLRPAFYGPRLTEPERAEQIRALGLDPKVLTLLLSIGDAGAHNHLSFLRSIEMARQKVQVIALCGHNRTARYQVLRWARKKPRHIKVVALAYVDQMHRLIQSVDALVARPGTGATSEAILCACPIIHNAIGGIMPQEWITVKFCLKNNFSRLISTAHQLARLVRRMAQDPSELTLIREHQRKATPPGSPQQILEWILESPHAPLS